MQIAEIVSRLQAGDATALEALWLHFGEDLRRRARTRLRQYGIAHEAESMDICNAVLMDLIRQGRIRLERPQDAIHYILRAVDNEVRDAFRQLSRQRRDFRRVDQQPVEDHRVAGTQATPSTELIRREIFLRVADELDEADRPMVQWVLASCTWDEIGKRLGIEPDTARMRFQRAVRKVRERFAAGDSPPDRQA